MSFKNHEKALNSYEVIRKNFHRKEKKTVKSTTPAYRQQRY